VLPVNQSSLTPQLVLVPPAAEPQCRVWLHGRGVALLVALVVTLSGCPDAPAPTANDGVPAATIDMSGIRVLVADDPPLAAAIRRQWSGRLDVEINIQEISSSALLDDTDWRPTTDVIIYPASLLGELAARDWIARVPHEVVESEQLSFQEILSLTRLREIRWGDQIYALPFGSPQLTLFFRADLFDQAGRTPPLTWEEYEETAQFFSHESNLSGPDVRIAQPWFGCAEPLADGWASQLLLARAAAYAQHPSNFSTLFHFRTMDPLIDGPPFVAALEQLVNAASLGPPNAKQLSPQKAIDLVLSGNAAMAVGWPYRPPAGATDDRHSSSGVGITALPGSDRMYHIGQRQWQPRTEQEPEEVPLLGVAGRVGSVTTSSSRRTAAFRVLVWLTGTELSAEIAPLSGATAPFRVSHLKQAARWTPDGEATSLDVDYGRLLEQRQRTHAWVHSPRIPARREYLDALDQAVYQALAGEGTAAEALTRCAENWQSITDAVGREQQLRAYRQSLGLK